jgi:hypothetical protein
MSNPVCTFQRRSKIRNQDIEMRRYLNPDLIDTRTTPTPEACQGRIDVKRGSPRVQV